MTITDRFLKYVSFDTQSAEDTGKTPSTDKQMLFAEALRQELIDEGLEDVELDALGYLYATLPANTDKSVPTIGFISHLDTSPDAPGKDIRPRIVHNYDGGDIILSEGIVSSPKQFPELLDHIGDDLIVTDGTTLLGADDKSGIAAIVEAMVYLKTHPEIEHGKIRIAFNPDEEIGMGAHHFDVKKFGCQFAYTIDGSECGEIEFENFNAAGAKILIEGRSVHPGSAKGKMINAGRIATEIVQMLPQDETPETTEGYEGFYHLTAIEGSCTKAHLSMIIRDHSAEKFAERKQTISDIVAEINRRYGDGTATLTLNDQYYNMRQQVEPQMYIIDIARQAIEEAGMTPKIKAIRGGTDGAQLSFMGLPCPNLFAGGINFHGPYEFLPIQSMERAMRTIVNICRITTQHEWK
ncbi:MAG: peptidase T [Bacteroidaceae bacterium]|nr:peptidase T [Bacteroidaceae bacterium]